MTRNNNIDLSLYMTGGENSFSSRTKGLSVRVQSNFSQLSDIGTVTIIIPENLVYATASFWEELLGNTIMDLRTEEQFFSTVLFDMRGNYDPLPEIRPLVKEITSMISA